MSAKDSHGSSLRRAIGLGLLGVSMGLALSIAAPNAQAGHWYANGWRHDHSATAIFPRPSGLNGLNATYGTAYTTSSGQVSCPAAANDARTYWPHQDGVGQPGYIYYHSKLSTNIGNNIRGHIGNLHYDNALDYGAWGYACRKIAGSTKISVHAWGAAIDTNSVKNPWGQGYWNGVGADGANYGNAIPYRFTGHNFVWGLYFSKPDPMHFQYAENY